MAAGNAIVTTSGTGCAQVVGDAARLVPPSDVERLRETLAELTSDPEACGALGAAGRRRLEEHFAWSVVVERYLELYAQAVR